MPSERNKADSLTWIKRELADSPKRGRGGSSCSVMYRKHRTERIALYAPYGSGQNIVSDMKSCPIGLKRGGKRVVKSCVRCQAIDPDPSEHNPFSLVKLELDKVGHQHNSL